jgi:hypothetical protein
MAFPPGFLWIPNVHHSVTWPRGWPTRPRRASAPGAAAFLSSWAENGHWFREFSHEAWWIFPVRYVKLPEGTVKGEHPWSNRWINMFEIYIYKYNDDDERMGWVQYFCSRLTWNGETKNTGQLQWVWSWLKPFQNGSVSLLGWRSNRCKRVKVQDNSSMHWEIFRCQLLGHVTKE